MDLMTAEPPILIFDGSFEGWLTCVFTIYENGWQHTPIVTIQAEHEVVPIFGKTLSPSRPMNPKPYG